MTSIRACRSLLVATAALLLPTVACIAQAPDQQPPKRTWMQRILGIKPDLSGGWLFVGFKNDSRDGLYFAISKDGYHWQPVNFDRPVLWQEERGELMRDPFIQRAPDGNFRMVWTWSANSPAVIGYSTSTNLIYWSKQLQLPVSEVLPSATSASAPATYYDPEKKDWLILFSAKAPGESGDRIYATTTTDFKKFQPAQLFFDPGYNVAGASLLTVKDKSGSAPPQYYLLYQDERTGPLEKPIRTAKGPSMDGPWHEVGDPVTDSWAEAPSAIPAPGGYFVYYDHGHDPQHYAAAYTADLLHWSDATPKITFPAGLRHGSLLHLETSEYNLLHNYHGGFDSAQTK
jgi:hypothetical protein